MFYHSFVMCILLVVYIFYLLKLVWGLVATVVGRLYSYCLPITIIIRFLNHKMHLSSALMLCYLGIRYVVLIFIAVCCLFMY